MQRLILLFMLMILYFWIDCILGRLFTIDPSVIYQLGQANSDMQVFGRTDGMSE